MLPMRDGRTDEQGKIVLLSQWMLDGRVSQKHLSSEACFDSLQAAYKLNSCNSLQAFSHVRMFLLLNIPVEFEEDGAKFNMILHTYTNFIVIWEQNVA